MKNALILLALASCPLFGRTFDVTQFGAKPDGVTDSTAAIQKAIDACSSAGGGQVRVPGGGVYKTYTLNLKNNVDLHIDRGATLKAGENPLLFPTFAPTDVWHTERAPRFNRRAMFYTCGQTNVAITGSGTIDGNAEAYHHRGADGRWRRNSDTNICGRCVFFVGCRDVRFDNVLVYHPCGWSTWFLDCDRVQVKGVRIECHHEFPNGDGLHFGGCRDVAVSDCFIDAQDDAIIVRTHQEQMRKVRPCERMTFANLILRSNQNAIRLGWTGDGPIRDVSFDNIVSHYSRLGVQFYLPPLPDAPRECMDPPRGRGLVPPPKSSIVPFSIENMHFSNMTINSREAPFSIGVAASEAVDFMKNVTFSHCRFRSQRPPIVACRPEDNVRDWRFDDVVFEIAKPKGSVRHDAGLWGMPSAGVVWFENARNITMNNVRWDYFPQDTPEWYLFLRKVGENIPNPVCLPGSRQAVREETGPSGARVFTYDTLSDGCCTWNIRVVIEERVTSGGKSYRGTIVNNDPGIRVTSFDGPYFDRLRVDPNEGALYCPIGLGQRITDFPRSVAEVKPAERGWTPYGDGRIVYNTGFYPSVHGITMPWAALDTGWGTWYVGAHDAAAQSKRLRFRWTPGERRLEASVEHRFFLEAGQTWQIPETVCEKMPGDWHDAAKRYRRWFDSVHQARATAPAWTKTATGQLLVILRQQNGQLAWPYTDIPKICDVAQQHGLDTIGLFGWTEKGHDNTYPDYVPSKEGGGVAALKAGIAEAHRRGLRVYIYANGQLQHIGATQFWKDHGAKLALVNRDGSLVRQSYHKFSNTPDIPFSLCCLHGRAWYDRMYALAEQANGFGADGILYDQLGVFSPFACYGKGHGHPTPAYSYGAERPGFLRSIVDGIQKKNPDFTLLTEGLHDTILDSIGIFHGCEYGCFSGDVTQMRRRAVNPKSRVFPELWRYTFPELVTTLRYWTPMVPHSVANYACVFGCRHEIEVRYAADRTYVLTGQNQTKADYPHVINLPDLIAMASTPQADARDYLKHVCDFQRRHAKYLLTGRFVDEEGFACANPALVAKRFVAADGTSAVCVWNVTERPADVPLTGLGRPTGVFAPEGTSATGALAGNSLRLYVFPAAGACGGTGR